jgi:hypothetical protein
MNDNYCILAIALLYPHLLTPENAAKLFYHEGHWIKNYERKGVVPRWMFSDAYRNRLSRKRA